jgi:hypothetical protein
MQVQTKIQIIAKFRNNEVLRSNRFTSSGRLCGREQLPDMEPSRWPFGMWIRRELWHLVSVEIKKKRICVCRFGLFRPLSKRKCLTAHHMHVILYVYEASSECVRHYLWNTPLCKERIHNVKRDDVHVDGVRPRTQRETWWCSCRWGETTYTTWNVMMFMSMGWDLVNNLKRDDVHVDGVRPRTQRETWWCSCRWGAELLPPRGLFFIPHVTWAWRTIVECYRQGRTPDSSTRTLWQFYQ